MPLKSGHCVSSALSSDFTSFWKYPNPSQQTPFFRVSMADEKKRKG
jgi:hypothetical protein